jgi:hypothetical protein
MLLDVRSQQPYVSVPPEAFAWGACGPMITKSSMTNPSSVSSSAESFVLRLGDVAWLADAGLRPAIDADESADT